MKQVINKLDVLSSQVSINSLSDSVTLIGKHNCYRDYCFSILKCIGYQKYQWFDLFTQDRLSNETHKSIKDAVKWAMVDHNHLPKIYTVDSHEDLIAYLTKNGELGLTKADLKVGMKVKLARKTPGFFTCFSVGDVVTITDINSWNSDEIEAKKDGTYQNLKIQDLELLPELKPGNKVRALRSSRFYSWQTLTYRGLSMWNGKAVIEDSEGRQEDVNIEDLELVS